MDHPPRPGMESGGYLGNSRVILNHFDAATQADIHHTLLSYDSDDEMGRRGRAHPTLYSKQDIREQYCISERGLGALERRGSSGLFGCLAHSSPCSAARGSLLTVCVRRRVPSDENISERWRREDCAPVPRYPRYPWTPPDLYRYDSSLQCSYFRRRPRSLCGGPDPSRFTWLPADEDAVRLERPRSVRANAELRHSTEALWAAQPVCLVHQQPAPVMLPTAMASESGSIHRPKHVSFARSHTLTSFDDAVVSIGCTGSGSNSRLARSQERLLDGRKTADPPPITRQPEPSEQRVVLEKLKRLPMKTQATQTEVCLGRKPVPSAQLTLSPRTIHRVKMVSQGAQTNGIFNGRKLMKSYSEAGTKFPNEEPEQVDHEPLQRTQSEEPPRSPFIVKTPSPDPEVEEKPVEESSKSEEDDSESKKEIIIDFEPQIPSSPLKKKPLLKTSSDGEILLDKRRAQYHETPQKNITSVSHDNIAIEPEPRSFVPYFQNSPIRHEDIFKDLNGHPIFSSVENEEGTSFRAQDSIDEEFHENLIYGGLFRKSSSSDKNSHSPSPEEDGVVPTLHLLEQKVSPFASTDSLANDLRDHSDGIWNESQATVLQADSGTENGTGMSASELSSTLSTLSPGATTLLTPSSRRKHLLMLQHQQRSSMDTDALDEESQGEGLEPQPAPRSSSPHYPHLLAPPTAPLPRRHPPSPLRSRHPITPQDARLSESALELRELRHSNGAAIVPDLLLARTDSGRTNTDVSESTTTEDYMTANSGTDSSRRSTERDRDGRHYHHPAQQEGSSFESASSIYSLAPPSLLSEDMVVPSFSPPPILEEASDAATPVPPPVASRSRSRSRSASSSSSGSYSLEGDAEPEQRHVPSVSDDERERCSSSGYYESPLEDDTGRTKSDHREWTDEEKRRKKRAFTLDIKHQTEDQSQPQKAPEKKSPHTHKPDKEEVPIQSSPRNLQAEKVKRKVRNRSPMQGRRISTALKKSPTQSHTPEVVEDPHTSGQPAGTSDESSSGVCGDVQLQAQNQSSPRKIRKIRDGNRRKSTPRSPTTSRGKRRNGSGDDKPSSLPGSLPRRRTKHDSAEENHSNTLPATKSSRLSPYKSPSSSPHPSKPDPPRLKALSAESLRSVSPGSDSVFYSDPSSHAAVEHQVHCLHCGKEVDIVTTDDPDKSASSNGVPQEIVQPPEGFADSPRLKHRLYKKLEKRYRSEERSYEKRHHKYRPDVRAKSEERGQTAAPGPRPRSASGGAGTLRAAGSSPSVLAALPDDDAGAYTQPYRAAHWLYIGESDEERAWNKSDPNLHQGGGEETEVSRRDSLVSTASTDSEHEFKKRYQAITHRMVHRKSCLEMYKRQASKSFVVSLSMVLEQDCRALFLRDHEEDSLRTSLQELLKLMLVVWCRENIACRTLSGKDESDKTIILRRESGEFGFRIHGSKPVVVSAIEPDTPAESSGLEVGDIVLAVNGVSVLDKSHSEVVKIAHAGSDTLTLEVARTCGVLSPPASDESTALYSGYLWKQGGHVSGNPTNKWIRRWFCLKKDNCLYSYKTDMDQQPVGATMLLHYTITLLPTSPPTSPSPSRPYRLSLSHISPSTSPPLLLAADSESAANRWATVLQQAADNSRTCDEWLEATRRVLTLPPSQVHKPDCFGYLNKLGSKWKTWTRRYYVLKDACIYFYQDANAKSSYGMACLHGYRVQQSTTGGKKHAFEILPSDSSQKHFFFHTESEMDRKRWLAALEYSIDRWLKVG